MPHQNLEQLRAAHALKRANPTSTDEAAKPKALDRSAINKLPALILSNGLLATTAFCIAPGGGDNKKDMKSALDAAASHLAERGLIGSDYTSAKGIIDDLSAVGRTVIDLQRATAETLAYLGYLKRFAPKKTGESED